MFGNKSQPSRIYSYGAKRAIDGVETVQEQMRLAHHYRNELVALDLERRRRVEESLVRLFPHLAKLEADVAEAEESLATTRESIRLESKDARTKVVAAEGKTAAAAAKAALKELWAKRKAVRKVVFATEAWRQSESEISSWANVEQKRLRAACNLHWGTYLHVEQAATSLKRGAPPRFYRFDGSGHLAVQVIGGMTVAEAMAGKDTRIRIFGDTTRKWQDPSLLYFRVGSNKDRSPVWAVFPFRLHRDMPLEARIKWVHIIRRRIATRDEWRVQFVLSAEEETWRKPDQALTGLVGIDLGWRMTCPRRGLVPPTRMTGVGLRVACWAGSDDQTGELVLPRDWLQQMRRTEGIRSVRDKALDTMRERLVSWARGREDLPPWWPERTAHMHQWRRAARFAGLAIYWRENRFPGDEEEFAVVETWRKRDRHLYEFEGNLRDQLQARRQDLYRNFAAQLRRQYHVAIIEQMDLRRFHRLPAEEETPVNGALREHLRDANLSLLIRCLSESMAQTIATDAKDTTRRCWKCWENGVETMVSWDRAEKDATCQVCGIEWDQDENAARNLLASVKLIDASAELVA